MQLWEQIHQNFHSKMKAKHDNCALATHNEERDNYDLWIPYEDQINQIRW